MISLVLTIVTEASFLTIVDVYFYGMKMKMGGKVVGFCLIGKGVKEKQVPLSILLENGLEILMTKVPSCY